jgi:hypothetical protein
MENCPVCKTVITDPAAKECPKCGLIFEKWQAKVAAAVIALERSSGDRKERKSVLPAFLVLLLAFMGAFWFLLPFLKEKAAEKVGQGVGGEVSGEAVVLGPTCFSGESAGLWDAKFPFPGEPMGLAWDGSSFLSCDRVSPWGMVRLRCDGSHQAVAIEEPAFKQKVQLSGVCWNGTQAVGIIDGAWFQTTGTFFVHLEGSKLKLGKKSPAPPLVNSLAWDGENYWTATRRNTRDSQEEAFLYKLDPAFQVVAKWPAPAYGCQGLAWAGGTLFWADVFDDQILLIKMAGAQPFIMHRYEPGEGYLSGLAWDGEGLWLSSYGSKSLQRLAPRMVRAWLGGDYRVPHHAIVEFAQKVEAYQPGNAEALAVLMAPLKDGSLNEDKMTVMADGLVSLGLGAKAEQALEAVIADPGSEAQRPALQVLLERMPRLTPPVTGL